MSRLQPVRGTHDMLGESAARYRYVKETARSLAARYGHQDLHTPIFEFTAVFSRTIGEGTDVVSKEMYSFEDRGGDLITLRPEFTAGICRAFISGGLKQNTPLKVFSSGPVFRYERPQKGRLRQFHQINAEIIGLEGPQADIEVITMAEDILQALGASEKIVLQINSLGDKESRNNYREALIVYLSKYLNELSEDSQKRFRTNPLRILDSKNDVDGEIVKGAPLMRDHLNTSSRDYFDSVCEGLKQVQVPYEINQRLVRGLDYYNHTAFEFVTDQLGSQGTVIAGGRYDGLIEMLGGPATPGVGWAGGIERLSMISECRSDALRPIALIPIGRDAEATVLKLARGLRLSGLVVESVFQGGLGKRLQRADKLNARAAVLIGDEELSREVATVRDLDKGDQEQISLEKLDCYLSALSKIS